MTSIYSSIHSMLQIPPYYHASEICPAIAEGERLQAIRALRIAGELFGGDPKEDLLDAIARKMTKLQLSPANPKSIRREEGRVRIRRKSPVAEANREKKLLRKAQIREALIQDPMAKARPLAEKFDCDESTIRLYRRQLRHEGLIP